MGKAALLADIHSNFQAFSACVADAQRWGAEQFVLLGDFVSDLSGTRETMALLRQLTEHCPCHIVRGNRERYMLEHDAGITPFRPGSKSGSLLFTYRALTREDLSWMASLPIRREIRLWGVPLEIAHATARSDRDLFAPDSPEMERVFEEMRLPFLLTGHSHRQYVRQRAGKTLLNPGTVGVPRGTPGYTQYARLEVLEGGVSWELMQIPYDLEGTLRHQFSSGLAELGQCWSATILWDLITGESRAMPLLRRVYELAGPNPEAIYDEALWQRGCRELGIPTEESILLAHLHRKEA